MYMKKTRFLMSYDTLITGAYLLFISQIVFLSLYSYITITGNSSVVLQLFLKVSKIAGFVINILCLVRMSLHRAGLFTTLVFTIKDNRLYINSLISNFAKVYECIMQGVSVEEKRLWRFTKILCVDLVWIFKLLSPDAKEPVQLLALSEVMSVQKADNGTLFCTAKNSFFVENDIVSFENTLLVDEITACLKNSRTV